MKKSILVLLAVLFVVGVAGVVLAEEVDLNFCPPTCDPLPNNDSLNIFWKVQPMTTIKIVEDELKVCTYIGAPGSGNFKKGFKYAAAATGAGLRKIVGSISPALPVGVSMNGLLSKPDGIGATTGLQVLGTADVDLVKDIEKLYFGMGTGEISLFANNDAAGGSGMVVLKLTILDQI
jgi:hypothetical protein